MIDFSFDEQAHEYRLDGRKLLSVTQLIEKFVPKFDEEYWSYYTAIRLSLGMDKKEFSRHLIEKYGFDFKADRETKLRYLEDVKKFSPIVQEVTVEDVLKDWRRENEISKVKGTNFHLLKETGIQQEGGTIFNGEKFRFYDVPDLSNLAKDEPVVYTELRLYNREYSIAGTSDKVLVWPNGDFYIMDYKTNKKIVMENKWQKMLPPLDHLDDTNFNHYVIQLSTYAWMLERFGYKCKGTEFIHYEFEENGEVKQEVNYVFKPHLKEVRRMLKAYKNGSGNNS